MYCCICIILIYMSYTFADYRQELAKLQSPEPPNKHCWRECDTQPTCYTSYRPHFNTKRFMEDIIVGDFVTSGWKQVNKGASISNRNPEKYGFIEARHSYEVLLYRLLGHDYNYANINMWCCLHASIDYSLLCFVSKMFDVFLTF